jgi:hypothetical protein
MVAQKRKINPRRRSRMQDAMSKNDGKHLETHVYIED